MVKNHKSSSKNDRGGKLYGYFQLHDDVNGKRLRSKFLAKTLHDQESGIKMAPVLAGAPG